MTITTYSLILKSNYYRMILALLFPLFPLSRLSSNYNISIDTPLSLLLKLRILLFRTPILLAFLLSSNIPPRNSSILYFPSFHFLPIIFILLLSSLSPPSILLSIPTPGLHTLHFSSTPPYSSLSLLFSFHPPPYSYYSLLSHFRSSCFHPPIFLIVLSSTSSFPPISSSSPSSLFVLFSLFFFLLPLLPSIPSPPLLPFPTAPLPFLLLPPFFSSFHHSPPCNRLCRLRSQPLKSRPTRAHLVSV